MASGAQHEAAVTGPGAARAKGPNLVAVHLGNALFILALIILPTIITQEIYKNNLVSPRLEFKNEVSKLSLYVLITIFIILVSGAIVASTNSTEACSGWPLCNGKLIPTNILGWIHMGHRALVALVSALMIYLYNI